MNDETKFNNLYAPQSQTSKALHNDLFTSNNITISSANNAHALSVCWFSGDNIVKVVNTDAAIDLITFFKCNKLTDPDFGSNSNAGGAFRIGPTS